ncbi:MAG: 4Fe-4S binding protein [Candidatus Adiutrix sp.]|nr:4Fe-4S binding protein [Candidatus Adiutrix sp.]
MKNPDDCSGCLKCLEACPRSVFSRQGGALAIK